MIIYAIIFQEPSCTLTHKCIVPLVKPSSWIANKLYLSAFTNELTDISYCEIIFIILLSPKKGEIAKIILGHLLQAHELLKAGGRVAALRKDGLHFYSSWDDGWKGRQEPWKHLQDCTLDEGIVEKTEADSPETEIFNCVISAYGDANWARRQVADVALWHSTWLPALSPRYLRPLLKWYSCAAESDVSCWLIQ